MVNNHKIVLILALAVACIGFAGMSLYYFGIDGTEHNIQQEQSNISKVEIRGIYQGAQMIPEIMLDASFPEVPEKLMTYTINREITEKEFIDMADGLGITGETERVNEHIAVRDEYYMFAADLSRGVITYDNETKQRNYNEEYIKKYLPRDEEARKIADIFLDSHNIRLEGSRFYSINHGEGFGGDPPRKISESINVWYIHEIDGYRVLTDKMYLQIDINGLVQHMFIKWMQYEPYNEYPVITLEEALGYLKNSGVVIQGDVKEPKKATVTGISLGYTGETQSDLLPYLIPVYRFEGFVEGSDGSSADFYQWIPATPEFAAEIT